MISKARMLRWTTNIVVIAFFVSLPFFWEVFGEENTARMVLPAVVLFLFPLGRWLMHRSRQHEGALGVNRYADDTRSPVLYLRPFDEDVATAGLNGLRTEEEQFTMVMEEIGPFVAIGQPGEVLPKTGAARVYVPDDEWKEKVIEYIESAILVVLRSGKAGAVFWELEQAVKRLDPKQLLIIINAYSDEYASFKDKANQMLPRPIPETVIKSPKGNSTHFISFDKDWNPIVMPIKKHWFRKGYYYPMIARYKYALEKVFHQLEIPWKKPRLRIVRIITAVFIALISAGISSVILVPLMM